MEEICERAAAGDFRLDLFKTGSGQISQKDLALERWLPSHFFREVADGEVNGICGFIPE